MNGDEMPLTLADNGLRTVGIDRNACDVPADRAPAGAAEAAPREGATHTTQEQMPAMLRRPAGSSRA
jgi:hypothetical protein